MDEELAALLNSTNINQRVPKVPLALSLCALAVGICISSASVAIGFIYLDPHNCPADTHLASILVSIGSLAIVSNIVDLISKLRDEDDEVYPCCKLFVQLVRLVHFGLFIWLCVIVFKLNSQVKFDPYPLTPGEINYYCNGTLFLFSYWFVLSIFILLGLLFAACCCAAMSIAALSSN